MEKSFAQSRTHALGMALIVAGAGFAYAVLPAANVALVLGAAFLALLLDMAGALDRPVARATIALGVGQRRRPAQVIDLASARRAHIASRRSRSRAPCKRASGARGAFSWAPGALLDHVAALDLPPSRRNARSSGNRTPRRHAGQSLLPGSPTTT